MQILTVFQLLLGVLLIITILVQAKGTGLGSAWGSSGEFYRSKRGVEKFMFVSTIILAILFLITGILNVVI